MIRLLHFSDFHLGMENYGRNEPALGMNSRAVDFLETLDALVDRALSEPIDLVLFTGDTYKTRDPNPTYQREFAKRIIRLARALPIVLLIGNHDLPNTINRANSVEIFDTLNVPNVHVAYRASVLRIETRGGPIQVATMPWIVRGHLLARDDFKDKTIEEINQALIQIISERIDQLVAELDSSWPAVLACHAHIHGATVGSERQVMLGQDYVLPRSVVARPAFNYVALGHFHKHQVLTPFPPTVYAGSLQRIDFGEEGEPKGYVLVRIPDGGADEQGNRPAADWEYVASGARRFLTIEVEADSDAPTQTVLHRLERQADAIAGAIVRVRVKLPEEREALFNDLEVKRALTKLGAHYIAGVYREVERGQRTRLGDRAIDQLSPLEVLRLYLEGRGTDSARIEQLLTHADQLQASLPQTMGPS